jgi:hypothetical protein
MAAAADDISAPEAARRATCGPIERRDRLMKVLTAADLIFEVHAEAIDRLGQ